MGKKQKVKERQAARAQPKGSQVVAARAQQADVAAAAVEPAAATAQQPVRCVVT